MKHSTTFLITTFSILCASNIMYGMEENDKPDIYCEEDIAIVLHFAPKEYNDKNTCRQQSYNDKPYPMHIVHNRVNPHTKINDIPFHDHMQNIQEIFQQASKKEDELTKKKINYAISVYLIASHSKHVPRTEDNIALPTNKYFAEAQKRIARFYYENFKKSEDETDVDFWDNAEPLNLYKIAYKSSYFNNNEQKKQNDIELVVDEYNNSQIKIVDKATIELQWGTLDLKIPNDMIMRQKINPLSNTEIKTNNDELIMKIHAYCNWIFLMDV